MASCCEELFYEKDKPVQEGVSLRLIIALHLVSQTGIKTLNFEKNKVTSVILSLIQKYFKNYYFQEWFACNLK